MRRRHCFPIRLRYARTVIVSCLEMHTVPRKNGRAIRQPHTRWGRPHCRCLRRPLPLHGSRTLLTLLLVGMVRRRVLCVRPPSLQSRCTLPHYLHFCHPHRRVHKSFMQHSYALRYRQANTTAGRSIWRIRRGGRRRRRRFPPPPHWNPPPPSPFLFQK